MALADLGLDVEPGRAVTAAQQVLDGPADRAAVRVATKDAGASSIERPGTHWHSCGPVWRGGTLIVAYRVLVTDKLAEEGLAAAPGRAGDRGRGRHQAGQGPAGAHRGTAMRPTGSRSGRERS